MRIKTFIIIILAFFAVFTSCKKVPLTIGKTVVEERTLKPFNTLIVNNDINLTLVRDDSCFIEIKAGENIIGNILSEVNDSILTLRNDNKVNWIRTYDYRIDATLHFTDIRKLTFGACGELRTKNQFNAENRHYEIVVDGGSGDIFMEFNNCENLKVNYLDGTSQLNLSGEGNESIFIYKGSYGLVHAEGYNADNVTIANNSTGDCWVNANKKLNSCIKHLGNIYYKGEPIEIVEEYGEDARGKLIKL